MRERKKALSFFFRKKYKKIRIKKGDTESFVEIIYKEENFFIY